MSETNNRLDEKKRKKPTLRDWFKKSKSKDGKPGWVQVVSGKPCARQPGQKTTPKCVSSAKRASMTKKERESAQRRKRAADPNQPKKAGAAKPTYVSTDKKKKRKSKRKSKKNEEISMELEQIIFEELEVVLDEMKKKKKTGTKRKSKKKKQKKAKKRDACYHKVKSRYKVWPSAYASGALVKCRKVGAKNWGNSKKESLQIMAEDELMQVLTESYSKEHEEELKTIVGELEKASEMHASQAERIQQILDETDDDKLDEAAVAERKQKRGGKKCWDGYVRNYKVPKGAPGSCKKKRKKIKEEEEEKDLYEVKNCGCGQDPCKTYGEENKKMAIMFYEEAEKVLEEALYYGLIEEEDELYEAKKKKRKKKKKKGCKPSKGKKYARRVKGKCVSYGAKGYSIAPGTKKGNSYCARSYGDMKSHGKKCSGKDRSTPLCLSRQKWKCSGKYSRKGK
jgi:hypothetical protein